jgi:hypothetical protein
VQRAARFSLTGLRQGRRGLVRLWLGMSQALRRRGRRGSARKISSWPRRGTARPAGIGSAAARPGAALLCVDERSVDGQGRHGRERSCASVCGWTWKCVAEQGWHGDNRLSGAERGKARLGKAGVAQRYMACLSSVGIGSARQEWIGMSSAGPRSDRQGRHGLAAQGGARPGAVQPG